MRDTIAILGIPFDDLRMGQVVERLDEFVRSGRPHQVATANTDFLVRAHTDAELRSILRDADLVVPDGMPVVWASRWLGSPLPERVTGADLVPRLARAAAERGYRVFILGAAPRTAYCARERLVDANPGLQVVGCLSPPFASLDEMDHDGILSAIEAARPDILLVAFGNPKQEKWIAMNRDRLSVPVSIGIGGTLDFIAGKTARAPEAMQRAGFEWLHRLLHEPRRLWRRYTVDIVQFGRLIARQLWLMRRADGRAPSEIREASADGCAIISASGHLGGETLSLLRDAADRALQARAHLILDFGALASLDSAALGTLLGLPKRAAGVQREVRVVGAAGRVARVLSTSHAADVLSVYPTLDDAVAGRRPAARRDHQGGAEAGTVEASR